MAKILRGILDEEALKKITDFESKFKYVCGKETAQGKTKDIKNNLQADKKDEVTKEEIKFVRETLINNKNFTTATQAAKLSIPLFAKYEPGMTYGFHYDLPIMMQGEFFRTDVSCTVFLNDDYDGGELEIKTDYGIVKLKGKAGDAILYPSGSYHRVAPVTKGERKVAVFWVQSRVQEEHKREIIYDLAKALTYLKNEHVEESAFAYARKTYDNLIRMWSVM